MSIERCDREIAALKALAMSGHPDVAGICGGIRDWAEERRLILRGFQVIQGDVSGILPSLEPCSFDACLCDPPYGLSFMGKAWDRGIPPAEVWREVFRVLKPGAHLLAFGGTRTHHRLMCAIEDAGFEIRDCLMWLYGSGFPKSLDVSKAIDKAAGAERQLGPKRVSADGTVAHDRAGARHEGYERPWRGDPVAVERNTRVSLPATPDALRFSGYGTALKPAWEPIILAMKPCEGTFAENALKWGVAGVNVDGGRVAGLCPDVLKSRPSNNLGVVNDDGWKPSRTDFPANSLGRWPSSLILDPESAEMVDRQSGVLTSGANPTRRNSDKFRETYSTFKGQTDCVAHRGEDSGGASRFYYIAKADSSERHAAGKNAHPTVKPVDLTAYLAKLLLPPQRDTPRRIIVPFCGSGSEVMGALRAGWDEAVGIEQDERWCEVARRRIQHDAPLLNTEAPMQPQPEQPDLLGGAA